MKAILLMLIFGSTHAAFSFDGNFKDSTCEKVILSYVENFNEIKRLEKRLSNPKNNAETFEIAGYLEKKEHDIITDVVAIEKYCGPKQ